jgi:hypothetical protein
MPIRRVHYALLKIGRLSGWLLFLMVLGYIMTGFSMSGRLGFGKLIDPDRANELHNFFAWPLVGLFLVHSSTTIYFALRRWGWITTRTKR